jgi:hypothetical protein
VPDLNLATLEGIWMGEANLSEIERPTVHGGGYAPVEPVPAALIVEILCRGAAAHPPLHPSGRRP